MMENIINRFNKIEEDRKNDDQTRLTKESSKSPQNKRYIINILIAKDKELTHQIEDLHMTIAGNNNKHMQNNLETTKKIYNQQDNYTPFPLPKQVHQSP
ncbi:hypothetical protein O181_006603 [Austropuccinia psidii MF-1]|uniref:Uncharacterized protein n=1 Tax=Austropuccinia psidii MF-1 TaxID=1389203 RepID=A0A9Q3BKS8_9BASI|nr:hypothetical protein [Austropuccinia psidii MF-1]